MKKFNSGVKIQKPKPTDHVAGDESGIFTITNSTGDWEAYLPEPEPQFFGKFDAMNCVSQAFNNCAETFFNYMVYHKLILPEKIQWLYDNGYMLNDKLNFSDRALAKMSNTTHSGNSFQAVADTARNKGLLPEGDWHWNTEFTWDDYYSEIPQALLDKVARFSMMFDLRYDRVEGDVTFTFLQQAPCEVLVPVCNGWSMQNPVPACSMNVGHAVELYAVNNGFRIFDSYQPWTKVLAPDYSVPYKFRVTIYPRDVIPVPPVLSHNFTQNMSYGQKNDEIKILQDALKLEKCFPLNVESSGYYGLITCESVVNFQKKYSLYTPAYIRNNHGRDVKTQMRDKLNEIF